jgi:hypothetical protein
MPRKGSKGMEGKSGNGVLDLRHTGVTRLNIPPAGIEARGEIVKERKLKYAYNLNPAPAFGSMGTEAEKAGPPYRSDRAEEIRLP